MAKVNNCLHGELSGAAASLYRFGFDYFVELFPADEYSSTMAIYESIDEMRQCCSNKDVVIVVGDSVDPNIVLKLYLYWICTGFYFVTSSSSDSFLIDFTLGVTLPRLGELTKKKRREIMKIVALKRRSPSKKCRN